MLAFRRLNEECFCGGTKQDGSFATPFIISNIDQWITSKLQATISINNTLISGSRTVVNSIKKASCVNRHHGADWQCHLPTKGCNGQSEMGVWGAMSSVNTSLLPSHDPNTVKKKKTKTPKQTLLAHIWGNKLETNESKWALRLSTSRFLQSTFPDGNSFPSLPWVVVVAGEALLLPCPTPVGPNGRWGPIGTTGLRAAPWAIQAPLTFQKTIPGNWGELRLINKEVVSLTKLLFKVVGLHLRRSLGFLHQNMPLGFPVGYEWGQLCNFGIWSTAGVNNLNFWEGGNLYNNLYNIYVVWCCENIFFFPLPRRRFNIFTDLGFRKES